MSVAVDHIDFTIARDREGVNMVARRLRLCLSIETAILLFASALLVWAMDWSPSAAAALAAAAFFAVNSAPIIITYPIALHYRRQVTAVPRSGVLRICRGMINEWLAFLAVFVLIQPFERWWMGSDVVRRVHDRRPAVLLVHGYACNRGQWWWLRRRLRARGFAVTTINLEPPLADIDCFAGQLHARIEAVLAETGVDRVALVAHSMGGLASRAYLRRHGCGRVTTLITLASPHHGTLFAHLIPGRNARQMQPDNDWIRQLGDQESFAVPVVSIWGGIDEFMVPQDSSRLAGARDTAFAALGHLSILFSDAVLQRLQAELERSG
jgi:triacylglycerol lipase